MALKTLFLMFVLFFALFSSSSAQTCKSYSFSNNNAYSSCVDLSQLSSYLYWTYDSSANTVDIAYRHPGATSSDWIAWAINPTSTGMLGAQALVAYMNSSSLPYAYTSPISSYNTQLQAGDLSFGVSSLSAEYGNNEMIIFATVDLSSIGTKVNQVWQIGPVNGNSLGAHSTSNSANLNSFGTIDFQSGNSTQSSGGGSTQTKKNTHGVLNAVSWGILMPIGVIIARYVKVFEAADPAWFYLHVGCQSSAYIVGVAGWGTGMKLGSDSPIEQTTHRNIGIALFCLGTLQVFALLLRPKKDHKFRLYWNIYHHSVGYTVILLSQINIFKGFDILDPEDKWKHAYIGILVGLATIAVVLEAYTWFIVIKRKRSAALKYTHEANGTNGYGVSNGHGANGYGARSQVV
ncbi:AIR12, DOMON domain [Dillenia turbinata]|uniref:Cytochrome b561 and DOMON domain-containing protein n=1 Tax=Dillenia turbinata TaxID=194707 RepID=A0AAN8YZZ7_9MAGN